MYVIKLSGLHCTGNVCVTQRKGPEEELLRALLGSLLLIRQPPLASVSVPDKMDIGTRQIQYRRQDNHEQLKQGKFQVEGKDHHKSSTQRHMVSSRSNDEGNILR